MKILITGGAGFIGSNLVDRLLEQGHEILVVDNYATSRKEFLSSHHALQIVEGTVADADLINKTFADFKPTHVIHAAASYKDPDDWKEDIATNVNGTVHIVKACQNFGIERLIYTQTALCYGTPQENPITIKHPLNPITSYSITKTTGERFIMMSGVPYVSLRLANVYGERHFSGPMPTFYKRLKAGQNCFVVDTRRDFIELKDLLKLIDKIIAGEGEDGCYNVSSGKDCSIKEIFDLMIEYMSIELEKPVEVIPPGNDDISTLLLDPSLTEKVFDWKADTPLSEGLKTLVKWYDKYGVAEAYTHLKIGKD